MAKLASITVCYEMGRQPAGQYTSDKMSVSATVIYEQGETPDLIEETKTISGKLKLACHKRITAPVETK